MLPVVAEKKSRLFFVTFSGKEAPCLTKIVANGTIINLLQGNLEDDCDPSHSCRCNGAGETGTWHNGSELDKETNAAKNVAQFGDMAGIGLTLL